MNGMGEETLAALKEIHPPPPVSAWPPAPGWWLLALGVLAAVALVVRWAYVRRRARAPLREALGELDRLRAAWREDSDGAKLAAGLSRLLRRVALHCFPRRRVAGLTGERWLAFLDGVFETGERPFVEGVGRSLLTAPYRAGQAVDGDALLALAERWIRHLMRTGCGV